jgi:hypothetical protein
MLGEEGKNVTEYACGFIGYGVQVPGGEKF